MKGASSSIADSSDAKQILRARAQALARPPKLEAGVDASLQVLEFRLAEERYAIETHRVREVYPLKDLTPLPCTPSFIRGIVNVRGRITPVIDIKKFFNLPDNGLTDLHRIILIGGNDLELGLLADIIVGVRSIAAENLQPALPTITDIAAEYLKGVTAERLVVLDPDRILGDPRIIMHEEVAG